MKSRHVLGWFAALVGAAVCLCGCSGTTRNAGAGASSASGGAAAGSPAAAAGSPDSTPKVFGSVDTDPSDAPTVEPSGFQTRSTSRVAAPWGKLPTGWNAAHWLAGLQAAAAADSVSNATPSSDASQFPDTPQIGVSWSTPAVPTFGASVSMTPSGAPTSVVCSVGRFDPADTVAAKQIAAFFQACAAADFPGSRPDNARAWITGQITDLLADLRTMSGLMLAQCATPTFGTGLYDLEASTRGETILLQIGGATAS